MKKLTCYMLFITGLLLPTTRIKAQACCCTGAGANYSILPNLDKHLAGVRYTYSRYNTTTYPNMQQHQHAGMDMASMGPGTPTTEQMHTAELFARFNLPARFQASVFVPVGILTQQTSDARLRTWGLSDISLLLQYSVLDPLKCTGKKSKHQLRLGVGVKAPTGRFTMTDYGMFTTDLQLGTGSVDFLFNAIYTYRYNQFGFNLVGAYKKNLANAKHFRFGDRVKGGGNLLYIFKLPKGISLMPSAGSHYNYVFHNLYQKEKLTYTGGSFLSCDLGVDLYYKSIAVTAMVSPVLYSTSNWQGAAYPTLFIETGVYYNFATGMGQKKSNKQKGKNPGNGTI